MSISNSQKLDACIKGSTIRRKGYEFGCKVGQNVLQAKLLLFKSNNCINRHNKNRTKVSFIISYFQSVINRVTFGFIKANSARFRKHLTSAQGRWNEWNL